MEQKQRLAALVLSAARAEILKKLVLSRPVDGDTVREIGTLCRVGGRVMLQLETRHADNKATHRNLSPEEGSVAALAERFAAFSQINLITTAGECEYRVTKKGAAVLLGFDRLSKKLANGVEKTLSIGGNNKEKARILKGDEPFLRLLGVSDQNGRIFDKKQSKVRQINRFLELVSDTLPHLPEGELKIADLCCGKSYLSFAVYHYFAVILGRRVTMTGVDLKPDVVDYCNEVATKLGFTGLRFFCDNVAHFTAEGELDLVVSLHACDVATDLVLERALAHKARVILSTPCCHHELNHTLECPSLAFLTQHSMLRQKLCDAATDALRLKWLEAQGYEVAALELIDPDDTPKNVMLRALRRKDAGSGTPAQRAALEDYRTARRFLLGDKPLSLIGSLSQE